MSCMHALAALLLASLLYAGVASAVGLGGIKVLSRMGQPFAAEIDLIHVAKDDMSSLRVSPAPPAAYQAANLPFDPVLNTLRLSVERRANGTHFIRATSPRPVSEPYLHLLVELTSQDGRFQRGYTALLDLPDVADPVTAAPARPAAPVAAAPALKLDDTPPRAPAAARPRARPAAPDAAPVPAPAVTTPAVRAPATAAAPAAVGNMAKPELKPAEPAKAEAPKPPVAESAPAPAEAPKPAPAEAQKPEPTETERKPAAEPTKPAPTKASVAPPQRGIVDSLMEHSTLIGGVTLALLSGLAVLWALRRREAAPVQPAERIAPTVATQAIPHTAAAAAIGAAPARVPTPSVAAPRVVAPPEPTVSSVTDTVDPLEEAKVYREHGQDEAAEKILREALSKQPGREDIQMQLLEILAARGDADGYNQLASRLHRQTGGLGANWKRAMAMGFALDPNYPLYSPTDATTAAAPLDTPDEHSNTMDINLRQGGSGVDMDKTLVMVRTPAQPDVAAPAPLPEAKSLPELDFELPVASATPTQDHAPLDFNVDFSSLSPKPDGATAGAPVANASQWEAVQHKIDLARAYREMGDKEGALELLQEVEREGDAAHQAEARELRESLG